MKVKRVHLLCIMYAAAINHSTGYPMCGVCGATAATLYRISFIPHLLNECISEASWILYTSENSGVFPYITNLYSRFPQSIEIG